MQASSSVNVVPVKRQKKLRTFQIQLETEDPEYVNENWIKIALNQAFEGPEFHEPEADHPPRLVSVSTVSKPAKF